MPPLNPDFLPNLARLGLVALLLAVCLVVAARFRHFWGTTPIAVTVGFCQVLQLVLALGLNINVFPDVNFSPGSVVVFPVTLFAILLVYVLEDEAEARQVVYGCVLANVTLALIIFVAEPLFAASGTVNRLGLTAEGAARLSRVVVIGAGLLAVDAFILIRAFEWFGERVSRNILARSQFALGLCVIFDAIAFSIVAFGSRPRFGAILVIDVIGKFAAGSFYSLLFVFLLPWSRMSGETMPLPRGKKSTGPITYKDRFQDLQKTAVRDALTGVFNRAYFDHELQTQADRAGLRGDRLLLLLIDLDSFKAINDTYGHPTGDRVLSLFGDALRAVARQNDTVCRYGGEEFAILIASGSESIAPALFERIKEEYSDVWMAATPPLTFPPPAFSVGGATLPADARTAEELLASADQRLYAAKRAGGNRLITGPGPSPS